MTIMDFLSYETDRLYKAYTIPNYTRSPKSLVDIHGALADYINSHSKYTTQDMRTHEYQFVNSRGMGKKVVDIALFDGEELKGVILFKGICRDYNKNANNYYENMKGESSLFIEDNIPVYQMMWLPSYLKKSGGNGWETPGEGHLNDYNNFIQYKSNYWNLLQVDVFIFDIDYNNNYQTQYSKKLNIPNCSKTIEEGLNKFIRKVDRHWTK